MSNEPLSQEMNSPDFILISKLEEIILNISQNIQIRQKFDHRKMAFFMNKTIELNDVLMTYK